MNVGLPGAGIGGLYYLICTFVMPFKEVLFTLTKPKHKFRYRLVFIQVSIASAIVIGFIAIYQLVNHLFKADLLLQIPIGNDIDLLGSILPVAISLALLIFILAVVELFAFMSKKKNTVPTRK